MKKLSVKKLALAGMLCALCVVGSVFSFPMFGSKCAPIQHMVNVTCAVLLGPWWGVGVAFVASLLRNLLGLGSLMAFPGSMFGALLCLHRAVPHLHCSGFHHCGRAGVQPAALRRSAQHAEEPFLTEGHPNVQNRIREPAPHLPAHP